MQSMFLLKFFCETQKD